MRKFAQRVRALRFFERQSKRASARARARALLLQRLPLNLYTLIFCPGVNFITLRALRGVLDLLLSSNFFYSWPSLDHRHNSVIYDQSCTSQHLFSLNLAANIRN